MDQKTPLSRPNALPEGVWVWRAESDDPADLRLVQSDNGGPADAAPNRLQDVCPGALSARLHNGEPVAERWLHCALDQQPRDAEEASIDDAEAPRRVAVTCRPMGERTVLAVTRSVDDEPASGTELEQCRSDFQNFAYAVSHDLREPLHIISGYIQVLQRRASEALGEHRPLMDNIVRGVEQLDTMIDSLLQFSRVTTEAQPLDVVHAGEELKWVLARLEYQISDHQAEVTYDELPPVRVDRRQFMIVLRHLLENALRFNHGKPHIHITAQHEGDMVHFSVSDNGIGFEPEQADRIFSVFRRLHRREFNTTGMGLAICRRIVERHGGHIWAEAAPEQGATFHFTVPAAEGSTE